MESSKPIPSPTWLIWREFRRRHIPWLTFLLVVAAAIGIWRRIGARGILTAVGEGVQSTTASPWPALLHTNLVRPYQIVHQGDPVAIVQPLDPRMQMDILRSQLDLARLQAQPSLAEQNALNYERVRIEWLQQKVELAMARVNLERAEKDLRRNLPLFQEKLLAGDLYDLSVRDRDLYRAEIEEKSRAVAEIEIRLEKLRSLGDPLMASTNPPAKSMASIVEIQQSLVRTNLAPLTLTAPMDGMVTYVSRQPGEYVTEGELLIGICSLRSERAIGYLRQPYRVDPRVGMPVQVSTRTRQRQTFSARISQVGGPLEYITNVLAQIRINSLVDVGLPVVVELPAQAQVRPGEIVDVIFLAPASSVGRTLN